MSGAQPPQAQARLCCSASIPRASRSTLCVPLHPLLGCLERTCFLTSLPVANRTGGDLTPQLLEALDPRTKAILQEVLHEDKSNDDRKLNYLDTFIATLEIREAWEDEMDKFHETAHHGVRG